MGGLIVLALTVRADDHVYVAPPASDFLELSNVVGNVRVLDSKGLVLERNLVYLPRIPLADLSPAQLHALLETKTAYASLTGFTSVHGTNASGDVLEHQLRQTWHQGRSLAGKIQTRLEILEDLRDYNNEIALVPGSLAAADQYAANDVPINNQLTSRAATVVVAAAQVEATAVNQNSGPAGQVAAQQAQNNYQEMAARVTTAKDRDVIANGQIAGANQQVTDHLARIATLSARLSAQGFKVAGTPPFCPVPPLTLQTEVDAERKPK